MGKLLLFYLTLKIAGDELKFTSRHKAQALYAPFPNSKVYSDALTNFLRQFI